MTQNNSTATKTVNAITEQIREEYARGWANESAPRSIHTQASWDACYQAALNTFDSWMEARDAMRDEGATWAARDAAGA